MSRPAPLCGLYACGTGQHAVKERSTHARPGMHMQQWSAVLTGVLIASPSIKLNVLSLAVFCQPQPLACILLTLDTFSFPAGPCSKAGTSLARPAG